MYVCVCVSGFFVCRWDRGKEHALLGETPATKFWKADTSFLFRLKFIARKMRKLSAGDQARNFKYDIHEPKNLFHLASFLLDASVH